MQFVSMVYKQLEYPEALIGNSRKAFNDIISPEYREVMERWQTILNEKKIL